MCWSHSLIRISLLAVVAGLTSCGRDAIDFEALEHHLETLKAEQDEGRCIAQALRLEQNQLDGDLRSLTMSISETRLKTESLQRRSSELHLAMSNTQRTGVDTGHLKVGMLLSTLSLNGKVFRDVRVKAITDGEVVIVHADGVARLKACDVFGTPPTVAAQPGTFFHSTLAAASPLPQLIPPPTVTASPVRHSASTRGLAPAHHGSKGSPTVSSTPQAADIYRSYSGSASRANQGANRGIPVEILAWWGPGSPYDGPIYDPFGNRLEAQRPGVGSKEAYGQPGRAAPTGRGSHGSRGSASRRSSSKVGASSAFSNYKPIGWNYRGSTLDWVYGRKP